MRLNRNGSRLRIDRKKEEINPMDGMANLADVMLVFACGLIIALIAAWNVDVGTAQGNVPRPVDSVNQQSDAEKVDPSTFEKQGTVYVDPSTGKMYIVDGE